MKLNPGSFALASALTASVLWIVCAALFLALPGAMMTMTGHMTHMDAGAMSWVFGLYGLIIGLVAWALTAALGGWLLAVFYNRFLPDG